MIVEVIIPIMIKINVKIIVSNPLWLVFNKVRASGTKSVIETQIMTPAAKESEEAMTLFSSFNLIKIGIVPSIVDRPAMVVRRKAIWNFVI